MSLEIGPWNFKLVGKIPRRVLLEVFKQRVPPLGTRLIVVDEEVVIRPEKARGDVVGNDDVHCVMRMR